MVDGSIGFAQLLILVMIVNNPKVSTVWFGSHLLRIIYGIHAHFCALPLKSEAQASVVDFLDSGLRLEGIRSLENQSVSIIRDWAQRQLGCSELCK